jgi:hypothetical protein
MGILKPDSGEEFLAGLNEPSVRRREASVSDRGPGCSVEKEDTGENSEGAGETLGRDLEVVLIVVSVIGNPRSLKMLRAFVKSGAFLNLS